MVEIFTNETKVGVPTLGPAPQLELGGQPNTRTDTSCVPEMKPIVALTRAVVFLEIVSPDDDNDTLKSNGVNVTFNGTQSKSHVGFDPPPDLKQVTFTFALFTLVEFHAASDVTSIKYSCSAVLPPIVCSGPHVAPSSLDTFTVAKPDAFDAKKSARNSTFVTTSDAFRP